MRTDDVDASRINVRKTGVENAERNVGRPWDRDVSVIDERRTIESVL